MPRLSLAKAFMASMEAVDKKVGWHRLPLPLSILTLIGIRDQLRKRNLYDTSPAGKNGGELPEWNPRYLTTRTLDGSYNDLQNPRMGAAGTRFGRNVPPEYTYPEKPPRLLEPNPRTVSRELLTRDEFIPATTLNILAAAWIQFEVHDWIFHGHNEDEDPWKFECADDDPWHEHPMQIQRTRTDPNPGEDGGPPTWVNTETHWWDGSQVYGETEADARALRTGEKGRLRLDERGLIPKDLDPPEPDYAGIPGTQWVGLTALHSLFMREHNAICDHLHERYPEFSDDDLYDKARLTLGALIAKIHTVEWTAAILAHPTTVYALNANWWGILGERFDKRFGRVTNNELIRGLVGAPTRHHGVPYSLTEEFVAVYRMHPLIPDEWTFRSVATDDVLAEHTFRELGALDVRKRYDELDMSDVLYSLGVSHPGSITLHNYPKFLQEFNRPDGMVIDLAATDIVRVRERGVPRYNEFRELFHMKPATSFEELTDNPEWAEELRQVYNGELDRVDLMIGMYAEPKPKGFGFSDTAFRVFVLMASRRLESDRFFTVDYRPEVYTRAGLDWIDNNTMIDVLLRHFPELEPSLRGRQNAFAPWARVRG
jgi:Animal haem peroxidase